MANKIAILNFKGGVAKTTTAINLCAALSQMKKKVLLIDLDGQCNSSIHLGYNVGDGETVYDALMDKDENTPLPIYEFDKNFDFVPADDGLGEAGELLVARVRKEEILKGLIADIEDQYDFIIIDCPPTKGILNDNAIVSINNIIIPIDSGTYSLQGLTKIVQRIEYLKKKINPEINLMGFLFTMYEQRLQLNRDAMYAIKDAFPGKVFNARIRRCEAVRKAADQHQTIFQYDNKSNAALDYTQLAKEIIKNIGK